MALTLLNAIMLICATLFVSIWQFLRVPSHLRHIPTVPILPLLFSYLSGEVEEQRVKRLVLPFAKKMHTDVVLVYCLGDWMVQIIHPKASKHTIRRQ